MVYTYDIVEYALSPRRSMYAIYAYIGVVWGVDVGILYSYGVYGYGWGGWWMGNPGRNTSYIHF